MQTDKKSMINGSKENWDDVWDQQRNLSVFGKRLHRAQLDCLKEVLSEINLPESARILDMGCGSGRSLEDLRFLGYKNSVGIDTSIKSLELCASRGFTREKDVFLEDGTNTRFRDNEFDLIYSQGLLEHFEDYSPFIIEMARISKKYVLILQPNHYSLYRRTVDFIRGTPVDEYTLYREKDYIYSFEEYNFLVIKRRGLNFNEQFALLFAKGTK